MAPLSTTYAEQAQFIASKPRFCGGGLLKFRGEFLKVPAHPGDFETLSHRNKWVKNQDYLADIPLPGHLEETWIWSLEVTPRVTFACRLASQ